MLHHAMMKENTISIAQAEELSSTALQCQTTPLHRILVVDDDDGIRHLNTEALRRSGYEVDAAENGAAGWEALYANDYDLLITDNDMPKVSGVDLLKKLRAARMGLPVILATGSLPPPGPTSSPWLQPDATLLKPYTIAMLLRTVHDVLCENDDAWEQIAPPPNEQTQPSTDSLQLR